MATQYTSILKLALPVQGELSGTWGDVVNDNITSMVEEASHTDYCRWHDL
jgi:hypothetical protein